MTDNVNHPAHYETGKFECIEVMLETQGVEATKDFCVCNALKYIYEVRNAAANGHETLDTDALREALPLLDRKLRGFAHPEAVLTGVETRSSSPVRILRGKDCRSPIRGLYPCGEGAGYAGGITSAAVDGMRCAEAVLQSAAENEEKR